MFFYVFFAETVSDRAPISSPAKKTTCFSGFYPLGVDVEIGLWFLGCGVVALACGFRLWCWLVIFLIMIIARRFDSSIWPGGLARRFASEVWLGV